MTVTRTVLILGMICLTAVASFAQDEFDDVEITTTHIIGPIYMLQGQGGNIGVTAGSDGILIIDDQFAPLADKILNALEDLNSGELQFILNTHYHGDHTGGNEILGKSAPIISHTNTRKRLLDNQKEALPVITFDDKASIHFNGEEIKAVHISNSHTDGDLVIFFTGSNVVHMGDNFFFNRFPYVDIDAGGNAVSMRHNIGNMLKKIPEDAQIIPGHGQLASHGDLRNTYNMLDETISIINGKKESGLSLEEIQAEGLPTKYESWGAGFIGTNEWIESVYKSLLGRRHR